MTKLSRNYLAGRRQWSLLVANLQSGSFKDWPRSFAGCHGDLAELEYDLIRRMKQWGNLDFDLGGRVGTDHLIIQQDRRGHDVELESQCYNLIGCKARRRVEDSA